MLEEALTCVQLEWIVLIQKEADLTEPGLDTEVRGGFSHRPKLVSESRAKVSVIVVQRLRTESPLRPAGLPGAWVSSSAPVSPSGGLSGKLKSPEGEHSCKQDTVVYHRTAQKTPSSHKSPAQHECGREKSKVRTVPSRARHFWNPSKNPPIDSHEANLVCTVLAPEILG